jgi:hypothetical protein
MPALQPGTRSGCIQSEILAVSGGVQTIHRAVRWSTCCSTCAQRCQWR